MPARSHPNEPLHRLAILGLDIAIPGLALAATLALAFTASTYTAHAGEVRTYRLFVAPAPLGDDARAGRLASAPSDRSDGPLATLEAARDRIRAARASGELPPGVPVVVELADGDHLRSAVFELGPEDGGAPDAPVIYRARDSRNSRGARPARILGGRSITFRPTTDPTALAILPEESRGKVLEADLRAQGIEDFGSLSIRGMGQPTRPAPLELFLNGRAMPIAQWPNEGWARIADVPPDQESAPRFLFDGDRPVRWGDHAGDLWLHGYWFWDWADSYVRVTALDPGSREIRTETAGVYGYKKGARYRALNLLAEIDAPGEWQLDRSTGMLRFLPPRSLDHAETIVSVLDSALVVRGASHVRFEGLKFEAYRGLAAKVEGGESVAFVDCEFRCIGGTAVSLEGRGHVLAASEIAETGEGGATIAGGDRATLTPGDVLVTNCDIHDLGRWCRTYYPGIGVNGVGNRITHNHIHDMPHTAILLGGNEHRIACNRIERVCMETSDAGAFYMGRDWTQRGNAVVFNHFRDLGRGDVQAIYLDDWASATLVFGNLVVRGGRGVLVGGGRDNRILNNVFIDCAPAIHVDARGLGWAKNYFDGTTPTLFERLDAVPYREALWSERYPELLTLFGDDPAHPKNNVIERNVSSGGRWLDLPLDGLDPAIVKAKDNWVESESGDAGFVDPAAKDGRLRPDAPARATGFRSLPLRAMGRYERGEYGTVGRTGR